MKLSFSTLGCPEFEWDDILSIAADMGYDGIEIRGVGNELHAPNIRRFQPEKAAETRQKLESMGLCIPCFTSGCDLHVAERRDANLREAREYIDTAQTMGVAYVRVLADAAPQPCDPIDLGLVQDTAAELADYAKQRGVTVLIESNGYFANSERLAKLIQTVGSDALGALWDIHHPYRFFGESPKTTYDNLRNYVRHTHFKDSRVSGDTLRYTPSGQGDIPTAKFVSLLNEGGYQGFMSLEWLRRWDLSLEEPGIAFAQYVHYMQSMGA